MGSSTCEQRELMKLFKCVIDTGNEVLTAFFDLKVLSRPQYGGQFTKFLEDEKHFLYHQWEQKRTMCCACPKIGCSIRRVQKMMTWIFQKLYETNGKEDPAHVIKHGGCIQQVCLHKFVTRNIAVHELDITVLSFFLRIFANMSASENLSLDTVSLCRSSICHSWSSKCFSMAELNKMWKDLETHLINLSEVRYQRIVCKQIQAYRKLEIDREEIAELTNHINYIREVVDDVNDNLNNNHNTVLSEFVTQFEKLYIKDSYQIQKSVSEHSLAIKQAQEEVVSVVKSEAHDVIDSLSKTKEDIMTKMSMMSEMQEELLHKFENVVFELKYDKPIKKNLAEETTTEMALKEIPVLWHISTPSVWNEKDLAETLKDIEKLAENNDIKIKFVRYGSLIILTTVPYGILYDKFKYEHAIKMFLTRMMDVCKINTEMACHVKATLHILEHDEVSIQHSYVSFEDKSTQMSIPQADKCFQTNGCELDCADQEELMITNSKRINSHINIRASSLYPGQHKSQAVLYPKAEKLYQSISSSDSDYAPIFECRPSKSGTNIYRHAPENKKLERTHSAPSIRSFDSSSFDSSYGSHTSSFAGSLARGYEGHRFSDDDNPSSNRLPPIKYELIKKCILVKHEPLEGRRFSDDDNPSSYRPPTSTTYEPPKRRILALQEPLEERRFFDDDNPYSYRKPSYKTYQPPERPILVPNEPLEEIRRTDSLRLTNSAESRKKRKKRKKSSKDSKCSIQ